MPIEPATDAELLLIAAGRGVRMGDLTREVPKALLPVDDGRSILEATLVNLHAAGATRARVVGGHGWPRLAAFREAWRGPVRLRATRNAEYLAAGPARSMLVGLGAIAPGRETVLAGNGDTLFSRGILSRALAAAPGVTLLVSAARAAAADDIVVTADAAGRIATAAKRGAARRPAATISAGLVVLRGGDARAAFARALAGVAAAERADGRLRPWHAAFALLAAAGVAARTEEVARPAWTEFDTVRCIARHAGRVPAPAC